MLNAPTSWAKMGPLLDEALDLTAPERESWLVQLEGTRPELVDELRRLLELNSKLDEQGFLESGPLIPAAPVHSLAGQRIGAYTLDSMLGQGGMGTVWLAHRSDGRFEGSVAIKLLNVALIGRPNEARFAREGSVLARLQHPNIARLADAGVAENGQPYLVLEYVEGGQCIDAHCERLRLDVTARIRLFLDVLAAVEHAHNRLVVHRDLKPPNILVTPTGVVKLLDFGVAALLAAESETSDLTREMGQPLTPEYAAPEQLTGSAITTATDVYALGLVLFVLLVGQHPRAGSAPKTRLAVMRAALEREMPTPSSVATDSRLKATLRGDLDNIIAKALKRDPDERYPTAAAFADDLDRYLGHEPVEARTDSLIYRSRKFLRRHAAVVGASSVVALLLTGTAVFAVWQMYDARQQRDNARYEARRAEASSEFMSLVFEEVGPSGTPLSLEQLLDRGVQLLERQNGGDPAVLSRMLVQASRRYQDVGRVDKQLQVLERAVDLAKTANAPEVLATALCVGVRGENERGRLDAARKRLQEATVAFAKVRSPALESQVDCMRASSEILLEDKKIPESLEIVAHARAMLESAGSTRGLQYTAVLTDIGSIYYRIGHYAEALSMAEAGVDAFERNGRGGTVGMTIVLSNIATTLYQMGEVLAADARYRANLLRETAAHSGPPRGRSAVNRGAVLLRLEKFDEARAILDIAVSTAREDGSRASEMFALVTLARTYIRRGDFAGAEQTFSDLDAQHFASVPDVVSASQRMEAEARIELELARGNLTAARAHADALLSSIEYPQKRDVPLLKLLLPTLARLALAEGDPSRAQMYAGDALSIAQTVARPGGHSADVGEALLLLCKAGQLAGRSAARNDVARAFENLQASLGPEHSLTREARAFRTTL
ncbi:MAG: eukaryotic-like serine/threonine-protein kinase [Gammaproteobacteria bacterium]|nr:eukaryotic-like serine/threonine-protein kinase [Gammaproteobacteria bacterium]